MMHPTPWTANTPVYGTSMISDANNLLVETVYGREGDPDGIILATRIVDAVNKEET